MKQRKTERIEVRLPKELSDKLNALAQKERRTVSNLVRLLIEKAVEKGGRS